MAYFCDVLGKSLRLRACLPLPGPETETVQLEAPAGFIKGKWLLSLLAVTTGHVSGGDRLGGDTSLACSWCPGVSDLLPGGTCVTQTCW